MNKGRTLVAGLLILMLALVLPACSSDSDDESDGNNLPTEGFAKDMTWQEYLSVGQSFSVQLPSEWEVQEEGLSVVSAGPLAEDAAFSIILDREPGGYTLDEFADLWYKIGAFGDNYQKISSGKLTIAGSVPAREFTEQWSDEDIMRKGTEVFFVSGGTGCRIYTESPLEQYDDYKPVFDYIIKSLRMTDAASAEVAWETHTNTDYGFSVELPFDWWAEASDEEAAVYIHSPGHDGCGTLLIANSEGKSLDEVIDASVASFESENETFEIISDKKISINGVEAREIVSTRDNGSSKSKGKGVGLVSGGLYYRASFGSRTAEKYGFFEPVWNRILNSFTVADGPPANGDVLIQDDPTPSFECFLFWCWTADDGHITPLSH